MGIASPVGEIILFAHPTASITGEQELASGWLICNGQSVSKTTYSDLWNIFSQNDTTTSPWDLGIPNVSNFRLPNLLGRMARGVSGSSALGSTGGAETITLTTSEIPAHSHTGATTSSAGSHSHTLTIAGDPNTNHSHSATYLNVATFTYAASGGTLRDILEYGRGTSIGLDLDGENVPHNHTWTSATQSDHNHTVSVNPIGSSAAHNNLPPYITLCYLIKY